MMLHCRRAQIAPAPHTMACAMMKTDGARTAQDYDNFVAGAMADDDDDDGSRRGEVGPPTLCHIRV